MGLLPKNVSKIGKELGTRGLMPSPRNGTVVDSDWLESAIKQCKSGRAIYKLDSKAKGMIKILSVYPVQDFKKYEPLLKLYDKVDIINEIQS